jgi:hypothetical protein
MKDYSKGKIYKIISSECDDVYYGSTVLTLNKRFSLHKSAFKRWTNGLIKKYCTSYEIIEKGNYQIVLLEDYPCQNEIELKTRERFYIENNDCVNKIIPNRTIKEHKKQYYQLNREIILEKDKKRRQENREKISEKRRQHYHENKELFSELRKEKISCEFCGSIIRKQHIRRHQRSQKCLSYQHQHDNIADCF